MEVYEALQIVLKELEDNTSCGLLAEKVRKAKLILYNYVIAKLAEDKEKESKEV